jgi:hypothetical protein
MTFRVGQKVVCIAHPVRRVNDLGLKGFEKGKIYTIAGFKTVEPYGLFISVMELDRRATGHVDGFRPLVERKTDISIFTEMLNPSKRSVDA